MPAKGCQRLVMKSGGEHAVSNRFGIDVCKLFRADVVNQVIPKRLVLI